MSAEFTPDVRRTGPVIACDNAIEHYTKEIANVERELLNLRNNLTIKQNNLELLKDMKRQWTNAKLVLEGKLGNG